MKPSFVHCLIMSLTATTVFYVTLVTLSFFPNALVIAAFIKIRHFMAFQDYFLVSLAVCDFSRCVFGYVPEIIKLASSNLQQENSTSCKAFGFIISFFAYVSIAHLMVLSVERAITITSSNFQGGTCFSIALVLAFIWIYGLLWATFPLLGWCSYKLEIDETKCSVDWADSTLSGKSYIMSLFAFCFFLPLSIMFTSFVIVRRNLNCMHENASKLFGRQHLAAMSALRANTKHSRMVLIMAVMFVASWTPYAVVAFMATLGKQLKPIMFTVSAYCGKSSAIINPVVYALCYSKCRRAVKRLFVNNVVDISRSSFHPESVYRRTTQSDSEYRVSIIKLRSESQQQNSSELSDFRKRTFSDQSHVLSTFMARTAVCLNSQSFAQKEDHLNKMASSEVIELDTKIDLWVKEDPNQNIESK